jgi:hypothetical protein
MSVMLSKIKVFKGLSRETIAFTASVLWNGKVVGSAENSGQGGGTIIRCGAATKQVEAYCMAQQKDGFEPGGYIDQLVDKHQCSRTLERLLSKNILIAKEGKVYQMKGVCDAVSAAAVKTRYPTAKILNLLPFDEAFALYAKTAE